MTEPSAHQAAFDALVPKEEREDYRRRVGVLVAHNRHLAIPISNEIQMRPVWQRRQRRQYMLSTLEPPTEAEMHDAILVLADEDNATFAPALHTEAQRIVDEAWELS